jgi:RNA polymerase sigma factor (sigma-70 family)
MTANRMASFFARITSEESDADLLRRYISSRDALAFEILVRRHGSLVFAICQRIIVHTQDAEDAFQAVFLVMAQKAEKIREPHLLQSWLYGVAVRVAKKAKRRSSRRREQPEANMPEPSITPTEQQADLWPIIDEEVARLAEHYRQAILLCDVQQLSRLEAAAKLGIPEGTLSSRLAKGRKQLAERLAKRGVALSLTILATVANAAVPEKLIKFGIETANLWASGILTANPITELAREGMTMIKKFFLMCGCVLTATVVGVGLAGDPKQPEKSKPDAKPATVAEVAKPELAKIGPGRTVAIVDIHSHLNRVIWSHDGKRLALVGDILRPTGVYESTANITKLFKVTEKGLVKLSDSSFQKVVGDVVALHPTEENAVIITKFELGGINARNEVLVRTFRQDKKPDEQLISQAPVDETGAFLDNPKPTSDGKSFLVALTTGDPTDSELREFDYKTGKMDRVLFKTKESLLAHTPDGLTVATVRGEIEKRKVQAVGDMRPREEEVWIANELNVWDTKTRQKRFSRKLSPDNISYYSRYSGLTGCAVFSHDGKRLVSYEDGEIYILDAFSGRVLQKYENGNARQILLSHDGRLTVIRTEGKDNLNVIGIEADPHAVGATPPKLFMQHVTVYDNSTGKAIRAWETKNRVNLAFAPDRLSIAIVESPNSAVTVQLPFEEGAGGGGSNLPPGRLGIWDFSK